MLVTGENYYYVVGPKVQSSSVLMKEILQEMSYENFCHSWASMYSTFRAAKYRIARASQLVYYPG